MAWGSESAGKKEPDGHQFHLLSLSSGLRYQGIEARKQERCQCLVYLPWESGSNMMFHIVSDGWYPKQNDVLHGESSLGNRDRELKVLKMMRPHTGWEE